MIVTERYYINEREFIRTYSDENRYVVRDGESYAEANDPADLNRTYTEGDIMVDAIDIQDDYAAAGRILLGAE